MRAQTLAVMATLAALVSGCTPGAPVDDADPDGVMTTNLPAEPLTIDPALASNFYDVAHALMVFEPLLRFDPKTLRPVPSAAKELPMVSPDGLTYRFTLRDGLKYSDGTPVTASDFAFAFARVCDPAVRSFYAPVVYVIVGCAEWNQIDVGRTSPERQGALRQRLTTVGVRAAGDKEVVFTLTEPASYFPSVAALWIGSPVRESDLLRGGETWTEPATYIGNGPFVLSAWKHGERMVFTPNRYYRSPPKIRSWTRVVIGEPAVALEAYRHDEIDAFWMSTASDVVGRIEADGSLRPELITIGSACSYSVSFNTRRPPFDDAVVRLAFARALDRGAYIREILGGQGIAATGFIPRGFPGHDPDDTAQGFDPAAARRLLSSSKYAQSLPAVVLHYITDNRVQTARQRWLRDRWKVNLGVDVLLEPIESSDLVQLFRRVETIPHLNHLGWCADYPDQQDWLTLPFHSDRAKAGLTGPARTSGFADPEFDGLLRQADHERAAATRDDLYRQASRILTAKAVIAPLHYNVQKVLVKPWVKGIVHSALDVEIGSTSRYEGIYIARRKQ